MKRCFICIDFPKQIREKVKRIQDNLPEFKGKKTEIENLHLTLKFLGEIEEEKILKVKENLKKIKLKKFKIKINKIGVFSEKFIRIVWLGVDEQDEESKKLWDLQKEIDNKLNGIFEKEKRFMGHITIARVKNIKDKKKFLDRLNEIKINVDFEVREFKLKESILKPEGPEYKDIEVYYLE